jgi:hypothetical protein
MASRQVPLAAEPHALMRFHVGHLEQTDEHIELVPPRQSGQFGSGLRDEGHSFIRPAVSGWIISSRTPIPARG